MYEQDKVSKETGKGEDSPEKGTEYRYVKDEIPHRSYMDASFASSGEMNSAPRSYYTPPEKLNKRQYRKEQKAAKKAVNPNTGSAGRWATLICACLVCALLGGLGGGAIVASRLPENLQAPPSGSSELNVSPSKAPTGTANPVTSGKTLIGSEVYSLGCAQAVGVTTEITYTNFFGMQTTTPVSGSGFIVTTDGYIVTNYHVIEESLKGGYDVSVLTFDGTSYPATIVGAEEQNDVAVLKIEATGLSPATLGNSNNMQVGETVYAIGNPLGELTYTMTTGSVSALDREITTAKTNGNTVTRVTNNMFQIDAAVNNGNSGGPVYNNKGEVIGIVTAKYASNGVEGLGFAIPINDAMNIISDLIDKGYVSGKPSFGITATTVDSSVAQYYNMVVGAYVFSVNPDSCSEAAGIKVGDIITAINEDTITSSSDLTYKKKSYKAGDTVKLTVYRAGEYLEISVTLDEEKASERTDANEQSSPQKGNVQALPKQ